MNVLNNFDKTDREYSPPANNDLITFWRSKVKGKGYSKPSRWRRQPCWCWGVEVYLL